MKPPNDFDSFIKNNNYYLPIYIFFKVVKYIIEHWFMYRPIYIQCVFAYYSLIAKFN